MRNSYELTLKNGKNDITVNFRLTFGGQIALKKKFPKESDGKNGNEGALQIIFAAMDDAEVMVGVFTEALNFVGNENPITNGEELYDLLVDNGYKSSASFVPILTAIANVSGLITDKQKDVIDTMAQNRLDGANSVTVEDIAEDDKDGAKNA